MFDICYILVSVEFTVDQFSKQIYISDHHVAHCKVHVLHFILGLVLYFFDHVVSEKVGLSIANYSGVNVLNLWSF